LANPGPRTPVSSAAANALDLAPIALLGPTGATWWRQRWGEALERAHFELLGARWWGNVVVELARPLLSDVGRDQLPHDHLPSVPGLQGQLDPVANPHPAMGLGARTVDLDLPSVAELLGLRAGLHETCDVEVNVEA
jgi:hypothetical protein